MKIDIMGESECRPSYLTSVPKKDITEATDAQPYCLKLDSEGCTVELFCRSKQFNEYGLSYLAYELFVYSMLFCKNLFTEDITLVPRSGLTRQDESERQALLVMLNTKLQAGEFWRVLLKQDCMRGFFAGDFFEENRCKEVAKRLIDWNALGGDGDDSRFPIRPWLANNMPIMQFTPFINLSAIKRCYEAQRTGADKTGVVSWSEFVEYVKEMVRNKYVTSSRPIEHTSCGGDAVTSKPSLGYFI